MTTPVLRSSTERTTNLVQLAGTDLEEDLSALLSLGEGPSRLLPSFLHEATHHWCYESPVGSALAVLQMRVHRAAIGYQLSGDGASAHELAETLNRLQTASAFLRPLDEGMALFAEFDLTTRRDSVAWSQALELAAMFFRPPPGVNPEDDPELFVTAWGTGVIQQMRLTPELLQRKANVLCMPLRCDGDAYLPGYLLVRQLWLAAMRRQPRLANETDLFLMYLRTYLYDDLGLVQVLLSSNLDELRGASAVASRIVRRLDEFTRLDGKGVLRFEAIVAASDPDDEQRQRQIWETLGVTSKEIDGAAEAFAEPRASVPLDDHVEELLDLHEQQTLLRRQFLYVGSWSVDVDVADGVVRVIANGRTIRSQPAREGARAGRRTGFVDVLQWIPRRERICAVIADGEVVAAESVLNAPHDDDSEVLTLLGQRDEAHHRLLAFDRVVEEVVRDTWVRVAVEKIQRQLPELVNRAYLPQALLEVPVARVDEVIGLLQEYGLYDLLDGDRSLIEGVAALGLCCSALMPYETAAKAFLETKGLDYERTLAAADRLFATYGLIQVRRLDGAILPTV